VTTPVEREREAIRARWPKEYIAAPGAMVLRQDANADLP
jgi:hypothetical protein